MAKRKASSMSRSRRTRRGRARKAPRKMRMSRAVNQSVYKFSRYCNASAYTIFVGVGQTAAFTGHQVTLADLGTSLTEFNQLFDQYRIMKIHYTFNLITNPDNSNQLNGSGATLATWWPRFWYDSDKDDSVAPSSINAFRERQGVKCAYLSAGKVVRFAVKPYVNMTVGQSMAAPATFSRSPIASPWLDMTDTACPHVGMKAILDCFGVALAAGTGYLLNIDVKIDFECRKLQ